MIVVFIVGLMLCVCWFTRDKGMPVRVGAGRGTQGYNYRCTRWYTGTPEDLQAYTGGTGDPFESMLPFEIRDVYILLHEGVYRRRDMEMRP